MKYGLFQTIEMDESGDLNPCWYVYDLYDTLQKAEESRKLMDNPQWFLIIQVW